MRTYILGGLIASAIVLAAGSAVAHHSFSAEFDAKKPIEITGVVTKVEWTNPHVWFYVNVKDEKSGEVTNWGAEMGPPHGLQRNGWRRETLKIGEVVTVKGSMAKNGTKRMNASTVTLASKVGLNASRKPYCPNRSLPPSSRIATSAGIVISGAKGTEPPAAVGTRVPSSRTSL